MARTVGKLAPAKVAALVRAGKPGLFGDGAGLALRISGTGAASWCFRYMRQGQAHEMGIGPCHTFSLAEAREKARRVRQELHEGIDPIAARRAARAEAKPGATLAQTADLYLTVHAPAWRSETHRQQWRQSLNDYVLRTLGDRDVRSIETADVLAIIEPIWASKTETASRVRQRLESLLDYAAARGWRGGDNPARWRGHLENLLPARGKVAKVEHHAAIDWRRVGSFMAALRQRHGIAARAAELCVLTATRSGEVRGARWAEIDMQGAVWTVPAERTKAGREHRIPLAPAALAVLANMEVLREPGGLVFPGARADGPLSDVAVSKIVKLCAPGEEVTLHGFRSTFRDWAGETTAYPREVIEMALAHRLGDKAEQAYARGDLFAKRRALMNDWAQYCGRNIDEETIVVPLRDVG